MGAKATFDSLTRVITLTEAPDENGDVTVDVQVDLYSDGKEDWRQNESLRRLVFPIKAVGGVSKPGGKKQGTSYFIRSDWKIQPYSADHRLIIEGDLSSEDGSDPVLTCPGYTVKTLQQTAEYSTVFEVETGEGDKDWTDQEHDDILSDISTIKGKTVNLPDDPASESSIGELNDVSMSEVRAQVDGALAAYDPPTRAEAIADKDAVLAEIEVMSAVVDKIWGVESGEWILSGTQQIFKTKAGVELVRVNLYDASGSLTSDLSKVRRRVPV
jgi:hypothetical protein